jgi:predicted ABC-type ATPase
VKELPTIYLIAGCNGAGKTTFAKQFLPHEAKCLNFLNADLIAQGLSPLNTRAAAIKAGLLLLVEFRAFVARRETFAFKSTLSGTTHIGLLQRAIRAGFRIHLHYLWLPNLTIAIARVHERVKKGGHGVPLADIRRRFGRSLNILSVTTRRWPIAGRFGTINIFHRV